MASSLLIDLLANIDARVDILKNLPAEKRRRFHDSSTTTRTNESNFSELARDKKPTQETRAHDHGPRGSAKDGDAKMAAVSGGSDSGGSEEQSNSEDAKKEEAESAMETTGDQVVGEDAAPSGAEGAPPAGPLSAPQTKMMPSVSPVLTETAQLAPPETVVEVSAAPPTSVSLEKPEHESSDDPMNVDDLI